MKSYGKPTKAPAVKKAKKVKVKKSK